MALLRRAIGGGVAVGAATFLTQQHAHCRPDRRPSSLLGRLDANSHPDNDKVIGTDPDGRSVILRTLKNGPLRVRVLDWGATITSVMVPDKNGEVGEVTLGFDSLQPYIDGTSPYFGCVAGRYANRICGGKFVIDGQPFSLATNNGANHLHGGVAGFDKRHWVCVDQSEASVTLALRSADGDEGYPGNLVAKVTYSLPTPTSLRIEYEAMCDAPTPLNLTNHSYWNLRDGGLRSVAEHRVQLAARLYTPVDGGSIPTGEVRKVSGAMDLTRPKPIDEGLKAADNGVGYDHNFVLTTPVDPADGLRPCASVWEPHSGRWMVVRTDQPGVQFYTGNYLDGTIPRRGGGAYHRHAGFCLETQHFPDSPNQPHFPPTVLRRGQVYTHVTVHEFGASETPPPSLAA